MTIDLDAIRTRLDDPDGVWDYRFDVRALLAEVDRLRALAKPPRGQKGDWFDHGCAIGSANERARALPVIEAARALADQLEIEHGIAGLPCKFGDCRADELVRQARAALAEYDR